MVTIWLRCIVVHDVSEENLSLRQANLKLRFLNDASQITIHRNEILVHDVLIASCDVSQAAIHRSVIAVKSQYAISPSQATIDMDD